MRISSYAVARPTYYDRAPATKGQIYDQTVAPHANTIRWTYTVGAGIKAYVETAFVQMTRVTAATTAANINVYISVGLSDSSQPLVAFVNGVQATVGIQSINLTSGTALLLAGDSMKSVTNDASTGGTVYFTASAKYTEFTA